MLGFITVNLVLVGLAVAGLAPLALGLSLVVAAGVAVLRRPQRGLLLLATLAPFHGLLLIAGLPPFAAG